MLNVGKPPPLTARLRFVTTSTSFISRLIRFDTHGSVSHVEAVMPDGSIIASLMGSGVQRLAGDYCQTNTMQIIVDLHMTWEMYAAWQHFLESRIGWPYDWKDFWGLVADFDEHSQGCLICSALQVDALRHCLYFPRPLAQKYHFVTPVVLLMMLQALPLSECIVHEPEYSA